MAKKNKTESFVVQTSKGVLSTFRFDSFNDDPEIGREKAYAEALRTKDNWSRNAPHYLPDDGSITIVEK